MRPLCSREYVVPAPLSLFFVWPASHRQHHAFGSHDVEPWAPNVRAWPSTPKDGAMSKWLWQLYERFRWPEKRCRGNCLGRRAGPENGTDPSWFGGGTAFLTLGTQGASATSADASSIQQTERAIALRPSFLWVERMIGATEQGSIELKGKSRSWKATSKRSACPLRRAIPHRRNRLGGGNRLGLQSRGEFGCAHGRGREVLSRVPSEDSTAIARGSARIAVRKRYENTSGQGLARCLRRQERFQRTLDADTGPAHLSGCTRGMAER